MKIYKINKNDNVAVALEDIKCGYTENGITATDDIPKFHKIALCNINCGADVVKYGNKIGIATKNINKGSLVHSYNLSTALNDKCNYTFTGDNEYKYNLSDTNINAYVRDNGKIGIRNEIWIIPTVGCVNKVCEQLGKIGNTIYNNNVFAFTHPYGCSQMGDDLVNTQKLLSALATHPNAGGVLIVSLGCENNNLSSFKPLLPDSDRIKFLCCQQVDDEIEQGTLLIKQLYNTLKNDKRQSVNISNLVVGFKCGGSDSFSGITANAKCGEVNDYLTSLGATTILTETPEMFGAEQLLMNRAKDKQVYSKIVNMINDYKAYFAQHNQVCYDNPSPGNHDGGITTLEEKSLGCIQKGGTAVICDVLGYADKVKYNGLNLLYGAGNDIVSTTNLVAAGAHIILFTTGRGTMLGSPVPTLKIASNTDLAQHKCNWIDFDAQKGTTDDLINLLISVANGTQTKNEINGYRDIAIFKNGVTM